MNFYIIIPAHNEQETIGITLESLVNQTLQPKRVVVVDDNGDALPPVLVVVEVVDIVELLLLFLIVVVVAFDDKL